MGRARFRSFRDCRQAWTKSRGRSPQGDEGLREAVAVNHLSSVRFLSRVGTPLADDCAEFLGAIWGFTRPFERISRFWRIDFIPKPENSAYFENCVKSDSRRLHQLTLVLKAGWPRTVLRGN
jgi:hypothetical protein